MPVVMETVLRIECQFGFHHRGQCNKNDGLKKAENRSKRQEIGTCKLAFNSRQAHSSNQH